MSAVADLRPRQALGRLLRDAQTDLGDYGMLAALLEQQFTCALRHDAATLARLAHEITQLADTLEQRRQDRVTLVAQLLAADTAAPSMAALFAQLPPTARTPVEALWTALESAVRDCKARNTRNARLMTEQQALMQRVLQGGEADTYAVA